MKTGMGLVLIGIGAIFAFAVTTNTSVFNLHTAGWVLMIIGVIGLAVPRRGYGWVGRRMFVRQARWRPSGQVEEINYPTGVNRNPANTRVRAGLPARALGSPEASSHIDPARVSTEPRAGETEIIEDIYENLSRENVMALTASIVIAWLIIGLVIGALGRLLVPGRQHIGLILTILIGIVAAIVAGIITTLILGAGHTLITFIVALIAAALLVSAFTTRGYGRYRSRRSSWRRWR